MFVTFLNPSFSLSSLSPPVIILTISPIPGNFENILSIFFLNPDNPNLLTAASSPCCICGTKSLANIYPSNPSDIIGPGAKPSKPDRSSKPETPSINPPIESPLDNLS